MISIENNGTGYKVKISNPGSGQRGTSIQAYRKTEAVTAVAHYLGVEHDKSPDTCPLCRQIAREQGAKI